MGIAQYSNFRYQLTNLEYKWLMKGTREDVHPRNLNFPKLKIRKSKLYNRNDYLYMIFNSLMTFNNLILPHNYFCTHYTQEQTLFHFQDDFQVLDLSHIYRCLYTEFDFSKPPDFNILIRIYGDGWDTSSWVGNGFSVVKTSLTLVLMGNYIIPLTYITL